MHIAAYKACFTALLLLRATSSQDVQQADDYSEHLDLRPLPDGKLLAHFSFDLSTPASSVHGYAYGDRIDYFESDKFPRPISSIIRAFGIGELHLSLVSGRWQYDRWGEAPHGAAPSGAELWTYLEDPHQWKPLTNALAGLFCASLNRLDGAKTTSPSHSFPSTLNQTHYLRHGLLPIEHPCTENLTPFLALLPCRNKAGFGALINPHKLFGASWQQIGVQITSDSDVVRLQLTVEAAYDPPQLERLRGGSGRRDWDFEKLFDRKPLPKSCPLARDGSMMTVLGVGEDQVLVPDKSEWSLSNEGAQLLMDGQAKISSAWPAESFFVHDTSLLQSAPLSIERTMTGYGQERGVIGVIITNNTPDSVDAIWLEEWPWWMRVFMHTLQLKTDSQSHLDFNNSTGSPLVSMRYDAATDRETPTLIEARLEIAPYSHLHISMAYEKAYLRYTEYPSDAMRGFALPSAILTYNGSSISKRVYSATSLVNMPTPDFSMPYNVIVMSCTLLALCFGTFFNTMTRKMYAVDVDKGVVVDWKVKMQ